MFTTYIFRFTKLSFKKLYEKQKTTHEISKRLFDDSIKYNSNSSIGEKKQLCDNKQKWNPLPPKENNPTIPYKKRIIADGNGSFLDLLNENFLLLSDGLPLLLRRCQRIHEGKLDLFMLLRLLLVKYAINIKPKT